MPSQALTDVAALFGEVDLLVRLAKVADPLQQGTCARSAVVLTHSHLERYVDLIIRELLEELQASAPPKTRWPGPLRSTMLAHSLQPPARKLSKDGLSHRELRTHAEKLVTEVKTCDRVARSMTLEPSAFLQTDKYPTFEHVEKIFERCGLPAVIGRLTGQSGERYDLAISNLNEWRGNIAHGDPRAPHLADVEATVDGVRKFIASLDQALSQHAQTIIGLAPW